MRRKHMPENIKRLCAQRALTFQNIFNEFPDGFMEVQIFAEDSVSKTPKLITKRYKSSAFNTGLFKKGSADILPLGTN